MSIFVSKDYLHDDCHFETREFDGLREEYFLSSYLYCTVLVKCKISKEDLKRRMLGVGYLWIVGFGFT